MTDASDNESARSTMVRTVAKGLAAAALAAGVSFTAVIQLTGADEPETVVLPETGQEVETEFVHQLDTIRETGWSPIGESEDGQSAFGYWRVAEKLEAAVVADQELRVLPVPVYDEPEGDVIGYHLGILGIVSVEEFEANRDLLLQQGHEAIIENEQVSEMMEGGPAELQQRLSSE